MRAWHAKQFVFLSKRDSRLTCHAHLFCVLPHGFSSKKETAYSLAQHKTGGLVTVRKSQCRRSESVLSKNTTHCLVSWSKISLSKYEKHLVCNVLHTNLSLLSNSPTLIEYIWTLSFSNPRAAWLTMWRPKAPIFNELHTWCLMKLIECLTWDLVGGSLLHVFHFNGPYPGFHS